MTTSKQNTNSIQQHRYECAYVVRVIYLKAMNEIAFVKKKKCTRIVNMFIAIDCNRFGFTRYANGVHIFKTIKCIS